VKKKLKKKGTLNLLIILFSIISLFFSIQYSLSDNTSNRNLRILQYDTLLIRISPVVENLTIIHNAPISKATTVGYKINQNNETHIWITPETKGTINFTIFFKTDAIWTENWGIITDKSDFYFPDIENDPFSVVNYVIVPIYTFIWDLPGNITGNLVLNVFSRPSNSSSFMFPTSINAFFFIILTAFLIYVNAFSLLNIHFKRKKEQISKLGWFLVILFLLGSCFIIYQLYLVSAFTSTRVL
jgi:hypothetical protein